MEKEDPVLPNEDDPLVPFLGIFLHLLENYWLNYSIKLVEDYFGILINIIFC